MLPRTRERRICHRDDADDDDDDGDHDADDDDADGDDDDAAADDDVVLGTLRRGGMPSAAWQAL
eukprot:7050571-Pyramimonas_sp.AAC.1